MRVVAAVLYIAVMFVVVVMANAGLGATVLVWPAASFLLGWITRSPWFAFLPLLASPMAVPFGYGNGPEADEALVLWAGALWLAPIQAAIVIVGVGGRRLYKTLSADRVPSLTYRPRRRSNHKQCP